MQIVTFLSFFLSAANFLTLFFKSLAMRNSDISFYYESYIIESRILSRYRLTGKINVDSSDRIDRFERCFILV